MDSGYDPADLTVSARDWGAALLVSAVVRYSSGSGFSISIGQLLPRFSMNGRSLKGRADVLRRRIVNLAVRKSPSSCTIFLNGITGGMRGS